MNRRCEGGTVFVHRLFWASYFFLFFFGSLSAELTRADFPQKGEMCDLGRRDDGDDGLGRGSGAVIGGVLFELLFFVFLFFILFWEEQVSECE